ncbi:DUF2232 domain-containing protein [[Clostridium] spiroforme]|nr:DUF2232 domain-containing protein [Thomasclavelia spiroformis]MBM6880682.1 DUF2232 domain-containing protein [Thomasclavelia spiroformis]
MTAKNTKKIVQGATVAALCGILSLINTYTGSLFDLFIYYFIAVYIAWYSYQYPLKDSIIVFICSLIVVFFTGIPTFIIQTFAYGLVGLYIGEALQKKISATWLLTGTFIICLINNVMIYTLLSSLFQIDLVSEMTVLYSQLSEMFNVTISLNLFLSFIPLVMILLSVMETYVIHLLCQLIFTRLKLSYPKNFHISQLKIPYFIGIVALLLILVGIVLLKLAVISDVYAQYFLIIGVIVFIVQGFALCNYIAVVKNLRFLTVISILLFFIPFGLYIYVIAGFLDIFTQIRKYIQ